MRPSMLAALMMVWSSLGSFCNQTCTVKLDVRQRIAMATHVFRGTVRSTPAGALGDARQYECEMTIEETIKGNYSSEHISYRSWSGREGGVIAVFSIGGAIHPPLYLADTAENRELVREAIAGCRWDELDRNIDNLRSPDQAVRDISAENLRRIAQPASAHLKEMNWRSMGSEKRQTLFEESMQHYGDKVKRAVEALSVADPQPSKHVYIFQCYFYPKHAYDWIRAPRNFTGTWRTWYENGTLQSSVDFSEGKIDGKEVHWYENGRISGMKFIKHGFLEKSAFWSEDGKRVSIFTGYQRNEKHGLYLSIDKESIEFRRTWFFKGKPVSEDEFRRLMGISKE
jgi:hypothetical protein